VFPADPDHLLEQSPLRLGPVAAALAAVDAAGGDPFDDRPRFDEPLAASHEQLPVGWVAEFAFGASCVEREVGGSQAEGLLDLPYPAAGEHVQLGDAGDQADGLHAGGEAWQGDEAGLEGAGLPGFVDVLAGGDGGGGYLRPEGDHDGQDVSVDEGEAGFEASVASAAGGVAAECGGEHGGELGEFGARGSGHTCHVTGPGFP
jgi:hypothetical protein